MKRLTRGIAVGMACTLLGFGVLSPTMSVRATANTSTAGEAQATTGEEPENEYEALIKEVFEQPVQTNELKGWPEAVGTHGKSAVVIDAESGAVLYNKNMSQKEYPASITKMLTALLVFEYDAMDLKVEITAESQECLGAGYANIGSDVGDVLTMEEAMYAMLLASANDVAYAIGETVAESQGQEYDWFVNRMNEKVKELGGVNSNFMNTNGVTNESHYTCAYDMALVGREICKYPEFFEICQVPQYTIAASETTEEHVFQQRHEMLVQGDEDYYEYAIGGKTGYTTEAQNTLVTIAEKEGKRLVCVVLYTYPGFVYSDTEALLEYGFANFANTAVKGSLIPNIASFPTTASIALPEGIALEDVKMEVTENLTTKGTSVSYYYDTNLVGLYQLDTKYEEVKVDVVDVSEKEQKEEKKEGGLLTVIRNILIVLAAVFVLFIAYAKIKLEQKRRRRRQRRERMRRQQERRTDGKEAVSARRPRNAWEEKRMREQQHQREKQSIQMMQQQTPRDRRPQNRRFD